MAEQKWTPGFGMPYKKEPKFYNSPKVKDANLPDDRTNVANPAHRNFTRFYTDDEILDIWAKPLEGFEVTERERKLLQKDPNRITGFLLVGGESPCACHFHNLFLDRCGDPAVGMTNKTMLQDTACNTHYYRLMKCFSKHMKWYNRRREALIDALPESAKKLLNPVYIPTRFDSDPSTYYEKKE